MKEDINNFWGYMPDGFCRRQISEPDQKSLVEAIDLYLAQIGFNNIRYMKISRIFKKSMSKYRDYNYQK